MPVATANYAFDKQSARSFDADGRMRVRGCVISVGEINPYYGREIPGWKSLGLDAGKVYDLYRDPDALAAAADSFNGPLMIRHVAQTADEPRKEHQGGTVYNVRYEQPNRLVADLLVSDGKAIEYVQSGMLADLSSSYRYKPDMTPGEIDGRKFDGRMLAIEGNHVALVEDGRATGAHVADSALSSPTGAPNVDPTENPDTAGPADVGNALLALTARLEAIEDRLVAVEGAKTQTPQSEAENGLPANGNVAANDEDPDKDDDDKDDKPVAMDAKSVQAAVAAAVDVAVAEANRKRDALETAKRVCRGDLGDMIAMDNAGDIYRAALKTRGVDVDAIPAGAEQATYQAIQSVAAPGHKVTHANDSSGHKPAFNTARIQNRGR